MNMPTCVMTTISKRGRSVGEDNHNNNNNSNDDDDDEEGDDDDGDLKMSHWFEGNQSHVSGYEWVDCRPKQQLQFHEDDKKAGNTKSTQSSVQAEQRSLSHDFRLAFLSLDAVKISSNRNATFLDDEEDDDEEETYAFRRFPGYCDCDTRWGIYHK